MPTYDYLCDNCGHAFELFQSMSDPVKRKCPECGTLKLQRLIGTGAAVIFKGGGFYQTDYRSDSYKKSAEAEKKAASEKKSDGDKKKDGAKDKADSKTPAKTDAKKTGDQSSKSSPGKKPNDNS